jgi:hypothetical protein
MCPFQACSSGINDQVQIARVASKHYLTDSCKEKEPHHLRLTRTVRAREERKGAHLHHHLAQLAWPPVDAPRAESIRHYSVLALLWQANSSPRTRRKENYLLKSMQLPRNYIPINPSIMHESGAGTARQPDCQGRGRWCAPAHTIRRTGAKLTRQRQKAAVASSQCRIASASPHLAKLSSAYPAAFGLSIIAPSA